MYLFVTDHEAALQWLKQQLAHKPQTFDEVYTHFRAVRIGGDEQECKQELITLLEQNFLYYDGSGPIPKQIISWLRQEKELQGLCTEDMNAYAKDRWYVPDITDDEDVMNVRARVLLREFAEYCASSKKRLHDVRFDVIRAGFRKAWQERDYTTIVTVARKVPECVIHDDPMLLAWYEQAVGVSARVVTMNFQIGG